MRPFTTCIFSLAACLVSARPSSPPDRLAPVEPANLPPSATASWSLERRQDDEEAWQKAWTLTSKHSIEGAPDPKAYVGYDLNEKPLPLPSILTDGGALPEWVIFDLDYTLWPYFFDAVVTGVIADDETRLGCFFDKGPAGKEWTKYKDQHTWGLAQGAPKAITAFAAAGIKIAIASSTTATEDVEQALKWINIWHPNQVWEMTDAGKTLWPDSGPRVVSVWDIAHGPQGGVQAFAPGTQADQSMPIPKSKQAHMAELKKNLGVDYGKVLFFDDFYRNKHQLLGVGVYTELVDMEENLNVGIIEKAILNWRSFQEDPAFEDKEAS